MANEYFLLFKTAQSENRFWINFDHPHKTDVVPIVELTRGRKKPRAGKDIPEEDWPSTLGIFDYQKNIEAAKENFKNNTAVILDVTREPSLNCAELSALTSSAKGYLAWRNFCQEMRNDRLQKLIPTLIVNPEEGETAEEYKNNLLEQLNAVMATHHAIAYRASVLHDTEFLYDIAILANDLNNHLLQGKRFLLIIDHEFVRTGTGIMHALRTSKIIQRVRDIVPGAEIVVVATSFPSSVTELGGEEEGTFPNEEEYLYDEVMRQINNNTGIYYGDYGSINPIRNDLVFARGGWRPRIDYPADGRRIFYHREKREAASYAGHYASVARSVITDPKYDSLSNSWGVKQIVAAAGGSVPSSAPSFWISVRMEIFVRRQVSNRFKS
ncbi:hypothetical protein U2P60_06335 [Brucella sp. H1_1004]|uniref:beta family protein n=1 Tax=Brucella sp. H1_1004 TaxID=3110109 RepID=UPI0039B52F44